VELDGFRAKRCRAVAEQVRTEALGACAEIAGTGCYGSGFVLGGTDGDFYAPMRLDFEAASFSASKGGEWYPEGSAKVLRLVVRCSGCNA
jgi:hypothetical protein